MKSTLLKTLMTGLAMTMLFGCGPTQSDDDKDTSPGICPEENRVVIDGHKYCVLTQEIIEKGFDCPQDLSIRHEISQSVGAVCTDQMMLPAGDEDILRGIILNPDKPWLNNIDNNTTPPPMQCTTPDPSVPGCTQGSCGEGEECAVVPDQCQSSSCACMDGVWACTADCGEARACQPVEEPQACTTPKPTTQECTVDADCGAEQFCAISALDVCVPTSCECSQGDWVCTDDCGRANECQDATPQTCSGPDPSIQECAVDADCAGAQVCVPSGDDGCAPSACSCMDGQWVCTADCGEIRECRDPAPEVCGDQDPGQPFCNAVPMPCPVGQEREAKDGCWGECVLEDTCESPIEMCNGQRDPTYQECDVDADCGQGGTCEIGAQAVCIPSSCSCDPDVGWTVCTDDCNAPRACSYPNP